MESNSHSATILLRAVRRSAARVTVSLALLVLFLTGCDNPFDPFVEKERFFVVSGFLDAAADTQFVRLSALRTQIAVDTTLNIAVESRQHTSGETTPWTDSLVQLADGSLGRLFYSVFSPKAAATYSLTAKAHGVRTRTVTTTLPDSTHFGVLRGDSLCFNNDVDVIQLVEWSNIVRRPDAASVQYSVIVPESGRREEIAVDYGDAPMHIVTCSSDTVAREGVYAVTLESDRLKIERELGRTPGSSPLILSEIKMSLRILSDDWGAETPNFFGSVARPHETWLPPRELVETAGFTVSQTDFGAP